MIALNCQMHKQAHQVKRESNNKSISNTSPIISTNESVSNECCVCFVGIEHKIGLIPCGHTTVCEKCIVNICEKNCPICREPFTQYVKLYL